MAEAQQKARKREREEVSQARRSSRDERERKREKIWSLFLLKKAEWRDRQEDCEMCVQSKVEPPSPEGKRKKGWERERYTGMCIRRRRR